MNSLGTISCPDSIRTYCTGASGIGAFITVLLDIAFVAGGIIFLFMIIFGAFQWLTSGGDKESLAKARARIINAIIGIALLSLAALIVSIIGKILGFSIV